MRTKICIILISIVSLIFLTANFNFAQEQLTPETAQTPSEPEVQWLWGEVVSVDTQNKIILVKYFDYESDIEKEITINVNDKTTYENVQSIDEIKPKDTVSIDYLVSLEGKSIAKNISVEKAEGSEVPQEETTPEQLPVEGNTEPVPQVTE